MVLVLVVPEALCLVGQVAITIFHHLDLHPAVLLKDLEVLRLLAITCQMGATRLVCAALLMGLGLWVPHLPDFKVECYLLST